MRIPNRRHTEPRVRTGSTGMCVRAYTAVAGRCECGVHLREGDSGAGVDTGQTSGELRGVHVRECEVRGAMTGGGAGSGQ